MRRTTYHAIVGGRNFTKMRQQSEVYFNATWAWKYINIVHVLGLKQLETPGAPFVVSTRTVTPNTLRQRLFGGRKYVVLCIHEFDFDGLRDVANQTIFRASGITGVEITPTIHFMPAYVVAQKAGNKYFDLLTTAEAFIKDTTRSIMTLQVNLSQAQQEGLDHFFKMRPILKGSMLSDSIVVLRK